MNTMIRRLATPFVLVTALLVGSTAQAGVTVTPTDINVWSDEIEVEWGAGETTRDKDFDKEETTRDGFEALREAADHLDAGGSVTIEWSVNEAGLYEVDVTLS